MGSDTGTTTYIGRSNNQDNFTGIYDNGVWRLAVTETGEVGINATKIGNAPNLASNELVINSSTPADNLTSLIVMGGNKGFDMSYYKDTEKFVIGSIDAGASAPIVTPRFQINQFGSLASFALNRNGAAMSANAVLQVGTNGSTGNGAYLTNGGTWTNASSRTLKEGFRAINPLQVLSKVMDLPISTWTYISSSEGMHIGPMAEDFKNAFGMAGDGKSIGTVDADGVALAAIQGLNQKLDSENKSLRADMALLQAAVQALTDKR